MQPVVDNRQHLYALSIGLNHQAQSPHTSQVVEKGGQQDISQYQPRYPMLRHEQVQLMRRWWWQFFDLLIPVVRLSQWLEFLRLYVVTRE